MAWETTNEKCRWHTRRYSGFVDDACGGTAAAAEAFARFGVPGALGQPCADGRSARWPVSGGERPLTLVRLGDDGGAWLFAVTRHMSARGWPVETPLNGPGGPVVTAQGVPFALLQGAAGEPGDRRSRAHQHVRGRLLARFHRDAASFAEREQRPGFGRAWELDLFVRPRADSFNALLAEFAAEQRDLAWALRRERYRNLRELARLGYGESDSTLIHGHFGGDGLLFRDGAIAAVAALDLVRRDSAMFDVAVALALECADPGGEALDAGLVHAFMAGYAAGGRLAIEQARLVLPLVRAAYTWQGMAALLSWKAGGGPDAIERLQRIAERRLPALDARRVELTEAIEAAAG
jgi:hypothetical protein